MSLFCLAPNNCVRIVSTLWLDGFRLHSLCMVHEICLLLVSSMAKFVGCVRAGCERLVVCVLFVRICTSAIVKRHVFAFFSIVFSPSMRSSRVFGIFVLPVHLLLFVMCLILCLFACAIDKLLALARSVFKTTHTRQLDAPLHACAGRDLPIAATTCNDTDQLTKLGSIETVFFASSVVAFN